MSAGVFIFFPSICQPMHKCVLMFMSACVSVCVHMWWMENARACALEKCVCVCVGGFVCMKESMCVSENVSVFAFLESTCTLFVVL